MGSLRFRRSFRLAPGIRLNVNKRSVGISVGVRGVRYSINSDGRGTRSVGIPGTGISYRSQTAARRQRVDPNDPLSWVNCGKYLGVGIVVVAALKYWYVSAPVVVLIILLRAGAAPQTRHHPHQPAARVDYPATPGPFTPKAERQLFDSIKAKDASAMENIGRAHPSLRVIAFATAALTLLADVRNEGDAIARRIEELLADVLGSGEEPWTHPFRRKYGLDLLLQVPIAPGVLTDELGATRSALGLLQAGHHGAAGRYDTALQLCAALRKSRGLKAPRFPEYLLILETELRTAAEGEPTRNKSGLRRRALGREPHSTRAERADDYLLLRAGSTWEIRDSRSRTVFRFRESDRDLAEKTLLNLLRANAAAKRHRPGAAVAAEPDRQTSL